MPEDAEIRKLYERYKLQWMIYHELRLVDLVECLEVMIREDLENGARRELHELFKAWEFGVGFAGGEIWPCFEEFATNEYQNQQLGQAAPAPIPKENAL